MARFLKNKILSKGQAPGSLIFIGNQKMEKPLINLIQFDDRMLEEKEISDLNNISSFIQKDKVNWLNIYGIHDLEIIESIGESFQIHSILLEDVLNTDQRAKYEPGESNEAFILKMLQYNENEKKIVAEQITIILGENYIVTMQEQKGDVFEPLRERIRNKKGKIRLKKNNYMAYLILDAIIDNYFICIEALGREIEDLEEDIIRGKNQGVSEKIYGLKTEILFIRKSVRPLLEIMKQIAKNEDSRLNELEISYLNDLNDLINQCTEAIELFNNILSEQLNIYQTLMSNRMNEVMKILTIFASIFIPLTFIAGVYGMNFEYIPELSYKYSYLIFWIVIISGGSGLLLYFKRRKWF